MGIILHKTIQKLDEFEHMFMNYNDQNTFTLKSKNNKNLKVDFVKHFYFNMFLLEF